jgi:hypothetical protein
MSSANTVTATRERLGEAVTRVLNHVELLHAPGEHDLACEVFELLGCRLQMLSDDIHMAGVIEPASDDHLNNALYVSEATPAQWKLETALRRSLAEDPGLAEMAEGYTARLRERPQDAAHFGIVFNDRAAWEARVDVIRRVPETHPHLARRLVLTGLFPLTPTLHQAFVWTDVLAVGVITFGQHIELQWQALAA